MPTPLAASIPPTAPPRPPIPATLLTTRLGNWSATVVSRTPFQMVWAVAAMAIIMTASQTLLFSRMRMTDIAMQTQRSITDFRLLLTDQLIRIRNEDNHPPAIDSTAVTAYTMVTG